MSFKWTILFLVHASDKKTGKYADELFEILESATYCEEVRVLVLYGGLQDSDSDSEGYKIQVTLKEKRKSGLKEVKSYGVIDMGDDDTLGPIFSDIRDDYPSDRFLLFTWDHGSGFGIFKGDPDEHAKGGTTRGFNLPFDTFEEAELKSGTGLDFGGTEYISELDDLDDNFELDVITSEPTETLLEKGMRGLDSEQAERVKTSMLTNDELSNILKYTSTGKKAQKVDLLIMMNCMMQMIETGYALHDAVEYLVAPETCIFWAGYDYKSIINKLCSDPNIKTEIIAKYAVDTIEDYYNITSYPRAIRDLVVSLVKPPESPQVKKAIDHIADKLIIDLSNHEAHIKNTRIRCEDLSKKFVRRIPYYYVDFVNYISCLEGKINELHAELAELKKANENYVIHIFKGRNYDKSNDYFSPVANGYTIYFPSTSLKAYNDYYYNWFYKKSDYQTLFAYESRWKDFLVRYFNRDWR